MLISQRKHGLGSRGVFGIWNYERVAELTEQLPQTRLVCVGERESHMLELMVQANDSGYGADYLLRCQHNRALPGEGKLWAEVASSQYSGELSFVLPPTKTRNARPERQHLRHEVTVKVSVRLEGSLLEMEEATQAATNAAGCCVSERALKRLTPTAARPPSVRSS